MKALITEYQAGGDRLRKAVEGLSRETLLAHPIPGTWSIQEVVIHLMDSDLIGADRMKRIIAEENPLLVGYDETRFSQKLAYREQSAEDAVTILDLNRRQFVKVLNTLLPETFDRMGRHSERGTESLGQTLEHYVEHLSHHLAFIEAKKKALLSV